jgi:hypothetical protein
MAQSEMRVLSAIAAGTLLLTAGAPASAQDLYCDLAAPPANAVVAEDFGHTIYIFPDELPARFTGCKTWWIETGKKYMVFRLLEGRVEAMSLLQGADQAGGDGGQYVTCRYPGGVLAKDAPKACLGFENAQSFADHVMERADAPKVPPEKDIRTKDPL